MPVAAKPAVATPMLVIELNGDDAPASAPGSAVNELALSLAMESQTARRLRVMVD